MLGRRPGPGTQGLHQGKPCVCTHLGTVQGKIALENALLQSRVQEGAHGRVALAPGVPCSCTDGRGQLLPGAEFLLVSAVNVGLRLLSAVGAGPSLGASLVHRAMALVRASQSGG